MADAAYYQQLIANAQALQAADRARQVQEEEAAAAAAALAAENARSNTWGEAALNAPIQLLSSAVGLGQAAYGLANVGSFGLLDRTTGFSDNFQRTQQMLFDAQSAPTQRAAERVNTEFDKGIGRGIGQALLSPAYLQQLLVGNAASLIPGAAGARVGAAAGAANATARGLVGAEAQAVVNAASQKALGRTVAGQVGGAVNVDTINAIEEAGGSETQQQLGGLGAAALAGIAAPVIMRATGAGALEAAAANLLPGGVRTALPASAGGLGRMVVGGAAKEATEEGAQSASERIAQNLFTPGVDLFDGVNQAVGTGIVAGGLLGGGFGAGIGLSTVRSSRDSALGQSIQDQLRAQNELVGGQLKPSGLGDSPLDAPAEEITLTDVPTEDIVLSEAQAGLLTVDELSVTEDIQGAPAPVQGLTDVLARFGYNPQAGRDPAPLPTPIVEELPAAPRTGLLGVIDAQQGRGRLGGTDLFAGPLDPAGAFPAPAATETPTEQPAGVPKAQAPLDFDAPPQTWKQSLSRSLGLKPQHLRGKAWAEFEAAVVKAGLTPDTATTEQLAAIAAPLGATYGDQSLFAANLATKYAPAAPAPAPAAPVAQEQDLDAYMNQREAEESAAAVEADPRVGFVAAASGMSPAYIQTLIDSGRLTGDSPNAMLAALPAAIEAGDQAAAASGAENQAFIVQQAQAALASDFAPDVSEALDLLGTSAVGTETLVGSPAAANDPASLSLVPERTIADLAAMTEDEYIQAVNPTGKQTAAEDVVKVNVGDLELSPTANQVGAFEDSTGAPVAVYEDAAGVIYAVQGTDVVGQIELRDGETLNIVTTQAQGRGIGTGLAAELVRRNPFAPAGSFSPAGEAARRSAFRRVRGEVTGRPQVKVAGIKQHRGGYLEGTSYVVSLSDGSTVAIQKAKADVTNAGGWYTLSTDQYLGETKSDATKAVASLINDGRLQADPTPAEAVAEQVLPASVPTQPSLPGSPGESGVDVLSPTVKRTIDKLLRQGADPDQTSEETAADVFGGMLVDAADIEQLSSDYFNIKAHPMWAELSTEQQQYVNDAFDGRYTQLAQEGPASKFDRVGPDAPKVVPMDLADFAETVSRYNTNRPTGSPEVIPTESVADFEAITGRPAPTDARGAYFDGNVYLIRENLGSRADVANVLAHERGHAGLDALLGDRMPDVLNRLWTNPATQKRIKAKMQALAVNAEGFTPAQRQLASEEVLADMLASGEPIQKNVLAKARAAVDQFFARAMGVADLRMADAEVEALLRDTALVMKGVPPRAIDMSKKHMQGLKLAMASPDEFTAGDPVYSRVSDEVEAIIAAAGADAAGTKSMADSARAAGAHALDTMRSIGSATAKDKLRSLVLDLVPLNQLANAYDKLFEGRLNAFSRLKRSKEATSNQLLTAKRELKYHGESVGEVSPMDTANAIRVFAKNKAHIDAWNAMQQQATLYRARPDVDWDSLPAHNYEGRNYTEADRKAAHAQLRRLWKAVGPEGQKLYRETQAIYGDMWRQRFETLRAEVARVLAPQLPTEPKARAEALAAFYKTPQFRKEYGDRIDTAMKRINDGPYSPLSRYGDYLVTVKSADGKVAHFSGHDTIEQANIMRSRLLDGEFKGAGFVVSPVVLRRDMEWTKAGFDQKTIDSLQRATDGIVSAEANPQLHRQIREGLVEAYLQSLPQGAFMQHANQRKNVDGASQDAFRGFSDYTTKAARSIASLKYDGPITSALTELQDYTNASVNTGDPILRQRVLEAVKRQHTASGKAETNKVADAMSQAGFVWFLSSPSQLLINATQTFMVTLPRLAGDYRSGPAIKELKAALAGFTKSRGDLLGEKSVLGKNSLEARVLEDLRQRGTLDFTLAHDMQALANGEVGSAMSGHWRQAMMAAGYFMHKSEVFNRQVVALATSRLEATKLGIVGEPTAEQFAAIADATDRMVLTTQFDYSQTNKPTIMQGPWRNLIMQFQQHRMNMLAMMAKDIRDSTSGTKEEKATARRALSWMLGTQLALTGAAGTVLAPLAFAIADMFRDDDDLLDSRTEFVRSTPQWLAHGLVSNFVDLSRVNAASLVSLGGAFAPAEASAKELTQHYIMANIGPWAGLATNMFTGVEKAFAGDHVAAVKNLAPAGIRDVYRAYFEGTEGAKDAKQVVYFQPGPWDVVLGAVGHRSGDRREAEEIRGATYLATARAQALTGRYLGRLALGHATGDQDMINEAMQKVNEWNQAFPDMAIKGSSIRSATISRVKSQMNATQYGVAGARAPSQSIQEAVGL